MAPRNKQLPMSFNPMAEMLSALSSIIGLNQLLDNFAAKLKEMFGAANVFVVLYEPITDRFVGKMAKGEHTAFLRELTFSRTSNLMKWLSVNRCSLETAQSREIVKFLLEDEQRILREGDIQLCVPLIVGNRLTGAIFMGAKQGANAYPRSEIQVISMLADQSALAIENAVMYELQEDKLKKLFHADKLATVGELAAGAAHEIRNPLTSIRSTVQYLQKELPEGRRDLVAGIIEEVDRIDQVIKGLLSFSRSSELKMEFVDLQELLNQTLLLLESEMRKHSIEVGKDYRSDDSKLYGDPAQLKQVFVNILLNSVQAMPAGGRINLSITTERHQEAGESPVDFHRIEIADSGPGIPAQDIGKIFHPFFTTKDEGTGLGLSIAYGIISKHEGSIDVRSETDGVHRGTTVSIRLPKNHQPSLSRTG